jgi:long-chain acyl-CoA synthetase
MRSCKEDVPSLDLRRAGDHYVGSMPARENGISTPGSPSAISIWQYRVREFADRTAFRFRRADAWQSLTWSQADQAVREIAAGLLAAGLERGDRVALLCQTRLEWLLCDVAIAMAGLVSVPIYPSSTAEQCAFIIDDSGARVVIAEDNAQIAKLVSVPAKQQPVRILRIEDAAGAPEIGRDGAHEETRSLAELRQAGAAWIAAFPGELERRADAVGPSDCFTIIYTSGTTGQPKGVVLSHANLVASCESAVRAFNLRPDDVQYLFLPLAHVLGREVEWAPIIVGSEVAFAESLARIKYDLAEIRPTFMAGVPRIFEKLYAAVQAGTQQGSPVKRWLVRWAFGVAARCSAAIRAKRSIALGLHLAFGVADTLVLSKLRKRLGLDRCRFLISGGAPLSSEIAEFFHGSGLLILEGYGLTETTAAAFVNRWNNFRFGTVGPAIDVIDFKLADDGEIFLRGPSVFAAYYRNPEATAEAFDAEGWFHTGDIGVMEDGFLRIVDRKKDIIITAGGKNVAPQKLENALKAHSPLVSQVVVFGDKRSYCVALVTLSEPAARQFGAGDIAKAATSPELRSAIAKAITEVNATLASYETVKSFAILPADFGEASGELTPSLKVKRDIVASKFAATIAGLYGG